MAVLIGVHPGGRSQFAVCSMYYGDQFPASVIASKTYSGVNEVLDYCVGIFGEWGDVGAIAIDAPLTWSGELGGWRACDSELRALLPKWAPAGWLRAPNVLPGATAVQGPALAWALAREAKLGQIAVSGVFETHPRAALAMCCPDLRQSIIRYRASDATAAERRKHIDKIGRRLAESKAVVYESAEPKSPAELDAVVCALSALAVHLPEAGLSAWTADGGGIYPVGRRKMAIMQSLPQS